MAHALFISDAEKACLSGLVERELIPLRRMAERYEALQGVEIPDSEIPGVFHDFSELMRRTHAHLATLNALQASLSMEVAPELEQEMAFG